MQNSKIIYLLILGSDCYELFKTMQTCMQQYPTLYNKDLAEDDDFTAVDLDDKNVASSNTKSTEETDKKS